jgi:hypothetical protein
MGLKLKELQKVVDMVVKNERSVETLQEEILRVLGPTILTSRGLVRMAESANERLDILEASGRSCAQIKPSLLVKFANAKSPEIRRLVARLIPENFLKLFVRDSDPGVRSATAKRLPSSLVKEMTRRFPQDDAIRTIYCSKLLTEAGLPNPKVVDEPFDMYGEESMSEMIGEVDDLEHTDVWYDSVARNIINQYGNNIERRWEEIAVKRYCDSMKTMGVEVDQEKLLDAIYDLMQERDENVLDEGSLKNLAARLRLDEVSIMPIISESMDSVEGLLSSGYTTREYVEKFEEAFDVTYESSTNPAYKVLAEGPQKVSHPASVILPGSSFRRAEEKAVDAYVSAWNTKESLKGNTFYKLNWSPDLETVNMVNFYLELK